MGTCPTPCKTSEDGVCVLRGSDKKCEGKSGLTVEQISELLETADFVRLTPAYLEKFNIPLEKVRKTFSPQEKDGVIELKGRAK